MSRELEAQLQSVLQNFSEEIEEELEEALNKRTRELKASIEQDSPVNKGRYKKGWAIKKEKLKRTVYNKSSGSLTHLLEDGHQKKNGGRTKAISHIKKNAKISEENFLLDCEQIIQKNK